MERRLAFHLTNAGIDRNDADALIRATRDSDQSIAVAATYGLGRLSSSPSTVAALMRLLDDENETLVLYAASSLAELKEPTWTARGLARLGSIRDTMVRIQLSGTLAKTGEYSGWPMIKEWLTGPDRAFAEQALLQVSNFASMKDSSGKEIDLAQELTIMLPRIPPGAREMAQYASESLKKQSKK